MTHLRSKRLLHRGRALAAVTALIASFVVGAFTIDHNWFTGTKRRNPSADYPTAGQLVEESRSLTSSPA